MAATTAADDVTWPEDEDVHDGNCDNDDDDDVQDDDDVDEEDGSYRMGQLLALPSITTVFVLKLSTVHIWKMMKDKQLSMLLHFQRDVEDELRVKLVVAFHPIICSIMLLIPHWWVVELPAFFTNC